MVTLFARRPAPPVPSAAPIRGRLRRARLLPLLAAWGLASAATQPPPEGLLAERRDGRVRDLAACGRKKACLMRQRSTAAEGPVTPTVGRSRWSEQEYDRVTVWIAPGEGTHRWRPADRYMVRDAFHAWTAAGAPVHFVFVPDSARADVRVLWRDSLPEGRAGQATRFVDRHGWLRAATVEMSLAPRGGRAPRPSMIRAIALHEVGHLLGLEHSAREQDIMAAWVTATGLSEGDVDGMRGLYNVAAPVLAPLDSAAPQAR